MIQNMESLRQTRFQPNPLGTLVILVACLISYAISFVDALPSEIATRVSLIWIVAIFISFLAELKAGLRNLIRVDIFALLSLYFFIYFEFLFPQSGFDALVSQSDTAKAIQLTLFGLGAIVIGRHIGPESYKSLRFIGNIQMQPRDFLLLFSGAFILAHLPQWVAVGFNPFAWLGDLLKPRFSQSWSRGKYGDLSTLLHELQLIGYVLPPIGGVILARWREYSKFAVFLVGAGLLVLWFVAFAEGTRYVFGIKLAGFLGGYMIVQKKLRFWRVVTLSWIVAATFIVLADMMLDFRGIGLGQYVEEGRYRPAYQKFEEQYGNSPGAQDEENSYFVDYNLWRISQMVAAFPALYDYIGWNMPFVALTKPIPRAFWPGKPMDLKVGLEEAIGASGYTIAVTWIGEAYVAGGIPWIVAIGLLIGIFCRYWNQLAEYMHSTFPLIVFASGFYAVLLLMRSLMFFTTALLPSIALVLMGLLIYKNRSRA